MSFFGPFLSVPGIFLALGYLLPVIVCPILIWRFGERSHWRLVPLIVIIALVVDLAQAAVVAYFDTIHQIIQRMP